MKRILLIIILLNSINAFSQVFWPEKGNLEVDSTGKYGRITTGQGFDLSVPVMINGDVPVENPLVESNLKAGSEEEAGSGKKEFVGFPSPNAASLLNLQGDDINLFQGRINQNIPIAKLSSYDISVPVSLVYSSSGIKVNDIAGWVGHGWNLAVGGQITRVMKGLPDEYNGMIQNRNSIFMNGDIIISGLIPALGYLRLVEKIKADGNDPYNYLSQWLLTNLDKYTQEQLIKKAMLFDKDIKNAWDTEADEFNYNFGGYSGKFVFNSDGEIISIPSNNLKIVKHTKSITYLLKDRPESVGNDITTTYTIITSFDVVTEDGTQYKFGNDDLSTVELTKYTTRNKRFLYNQENRSHKFYYYEDWVPDPDNPGHYHYEYIYSQTYTNFWFEEYRYIDENGVIQYYLNDPKLDPELRYVDISFIPDYSTTWYLREIISPGLNKVTFNYNKSNDKLEYIADKDESFQYTDLISVCRPNPAYVSPIGSGQSLTISRTKVSHDNIVLESIIGDNGEKIIFSSENDRPDLINGKRLKEIEIYNNINQLVKRLYLNYQDVTNTEEPRLVKYQLGEIDGVMQFYDEGPLYSEWFNDVEAYKKTEESRFFLTSLTESSSDDKLSKVYKFEYENLNLPPRFSPKQDQKGFLNNYTSYYPMALTVNPYLAAYPMWARIYNINGKETPFGMRYARGVFPDEGKLKYGMLKSITFPTGGKKEFQYEENQPSYPGLRLLNVKNNYGDGKVETINYTYEEAFPHETGEYAKFADWYYPTDLYKQFDLSVSDGLKTNIIYSSPKINSLENLGYGTVTVTDGIRKTEYHFTTTRNNTQPIWDKKDGVWKSGQDYNSDKYKTSEDLFWQRGYLTDIYTYSNEGVIKHVHNEYAPAKAPYAVNWSFVEMNHPIFEIEKGEEEIEYSKGIPSENQWLQNYDRAIETGVTYTIKNGKAATKLRLYFTKHHSTNLRLVKTIETNYDPKFPGNNNPISNLNKDKTVVNITEYDHNLRNQVIETVKYDARFNTADEPEKIPDCDEYKSVIKYPMDFLGNSFLRSMAHANIIDKPIETIMYKNEAAISSSVNKYDCKDCFFNDKGFFEGKFLLDETYSLETTLPINNYPSSAPNLTIDSRCKLNVHFDEYDNKGNLLQVFKAYGLTTSFLWAYNQTYPIAKIENSTYGNVENALSSIGSSVSDIQTKSLETDDETKLKLVFDNLRNSSLMQGALISSYTYNPGTGITSETDPSGKTTYYEYDDLGRLTLIRNHKQEILKEYDYHYKPTSFTTIKELVFSGINSAASYKMNDAATFTANKSDGSGTFSYKWELKKDGATVTSSTNTSLNYTFSSDGTYVVYCTIKDLLMGKSYTKSKSISVAVYLPTPVITGQYEIPYNPNGSSTEYFIGNGGAATSYEIEFTNNASNWVSYSIYGTRIALTFSTPPVTGSNIFTMKVRGVYKGVYSAWAEKEILVRN